MQNVICKLLRCSLFVFVGLLLQLLVSCNIFPELPKPTIVHAEIDVTKLTPSIGGIEIIGNIDYNDIKNIQKISLCIGLDPEVKDEIIVEGKISGNELFVSYYGLEGRKKYYYHFKIDNSVSSHYTSISSFETKGPEIVTNLPTNVIATSARLSMIVKSTDGAKISEMGVCWGTTTSPSVSGSKNSTKVISNSYSTTINNLSASQVYYCRGYVITEGGVIAYGNEVQFSTTDGLPKVKTDEVTKIEFTSATLQGTLEADGGYIVSRKGLVYGTNKTPTLSDNVVSINNSSIGSFSFVVKNLTPNTTYYVRSFATNQFGTVYGSELTFKTLEAPEIKTIGANLLSTEYHFVGVKTYNRYNIIYKVYVSSLISIQEVGIRVRQSTETNFEEFNKSSPAKGENAISLYHLSILDNITIYYQAYARLSNGEYIYGEQKSQLFKFY